MMCRCAAGPIINSKRRSMWRPLVVTLIATLFSQFGAGHAPQVIGIEAPTNKSNLSGLTFDVEGNVSTVSPTVLSPLGGSVGTTFDVPAKTVKSVVAQLEDNNTVSRSWIGVQYKAVTAAFAEGLGLKGAEGAALVIDTPHADSPAAKAGILSGDVILAANGRPIKGRQDFAKQIGALAPGTAVKLTVWRKGEVRDFSLTVAEMPKSSALYTEPILRIEAAQHVNLIARADVDAANKYVVTASLDKTVRVWSLPDGRLQRILRLPIGYDDIGKAFAVAISPDGGTVAVGGFTGSNHQYNIFLFDRASGAVKQRLPGIPDVIDHLTYSADGRRLAASLSGNNGIRVFDVVNGYGLLPSDTKYEKRSVGAHFDKAGRLVTVSYDGFVRLYPPDSYAAPVARFEWKGHRPYSVRFFAGWLQHRGWR